MTDEDNKPKLELSPTQVAGSALAAVSGAFFASWAGTAGTLIGVGAGSIIATVGAATYTWWLRSTRDAVRRTAAQVRLSTLAVNGLPRTVAAGPLREDEDSDQVTRTDLAVEPPERGSLLRRIDLPWGKVLLTSAAVMLVALAGITGFEAVTGRSVASFTGQSDPHGSTLGNAFDNGATSSTTNDTKTPATRTATPTPTPTPTSSPSSTPTPSATPTPSSSATATPSVEPTPTPGVAPTQAPSTDPTAGTGSGTTP